MSAAPERAWLVPERLQVSAMDCGPAALGALLAGCGLDLPESWLREACEVERDGTSTNALERVALGLGFHAEQVLVPPENVSLAAAGCLPAIAVVRQPNGLTHFVVLWRRHGPLLQIMDPATGRRWLPARRLGAWLHSHRAVVPTAHWQRWALGEESLGALRSRLARLGVRRHEAEGLVCRAACSGSWQPLATLDAGLRAIASLVGAGCLRRGRQAERALLLVAESTAGAGAGAARAVALRPECWSVLPAAGPTTGQPLVAISGAVLVRLRAPLPPKPPKPQAGSGQKRRRDQRRDVQAHPLRTLLRLERLLDGAATSGEVSAPLSPRDLAQESTPPRRTVRRCHRVVAALCLLGAATLIGLAEAPLWRAAFSALAGDGGRRDEGLEAIPESRPGAGPGAGVGAESGAGFETRPRAGAGGLAGGSPAAAITLLACLLALSGGLAFLELALAAGAARRGRRLEMHLRLALANALPRLPDRFVQSRPAGDLVERTHLLHHLRALPDLLASCLGAGLALLATLGATVWLDPGGAAFALLASGGVLGICALARPALERRQRLLRTRSAALGGFYLDALRGRAAIRGHSVEGGPGAIGAAGAVVRRHEELLVSWGRALAGWRRREAAVELAVQATLSAGTVLLVLCHVARSGLDPATFLLLVWASAAAAHGRRLILALGPRLGLLRAIARRLLEPLAEAGTLDELGGGTPVASPGAPATAECHGSAACAAESAPIGAPAPPTTAAPVVPEEQGMASSSAHPPGCHPADLAGRASRDPNHGPASGGPGSRRACRPAPGERTEASPRRLPRNSLAPGVRIELAGVSLHRAGVPLLQEVDLLLPPGAQVAVVGPSGAGKSTLAGLLLGWTSASAGSMLVDGRPLTPGRLARLRRATAWVAPEVRLWDRSWLENLAEGSPTCSPAVIAAIAAAQALTELAHLPETLPEGMATRLGDGGTRLSGGECQRLRLARALLRPGVRLALLDEPFRGLEGGRRRELLARARRHWRQATLLCITHDLAAAFAFERVLVLESGRLVEDGAPAELAARPGSRLRALLEEERAAADLLASSGLFRRLRLERGRLHETAGGLQSGALSQVAGVGDKARPFVSEPLLHPSRDTAHLSRTPTERPGSGSPCGPSSGNQSLQGIDER